MIAVEDALRILVGSVRTLGVEAVTLDEAFGRVLAEPVTADRDFPPTDRSAMDGFAVRAGDIPTEGTTLRVIGEVRAGEDPGEMTVGDGAVTRIFTGAVLPRGADAVVMVERTEEDIVASTVRIDVRPGNGDHIRAKGQDLRKGDGVLEPGAPIQAPELAALASVGCVNVPVYGRPSVGLLSTGDELVEPDSVPRDHQIRNSNTPTLAAQLRELGIAGESRGVASDAADDLEARLRRGLLNDVLLVTGGVSVGRYDLVESVLGELGMETLFHGVRVKPGKPILAGRCQDCLVIGLPGNPVSTFAGFAVFVAPVLRRMLGYRRWENEPVSVELTEPLRQRAGRRTYHLARVEARDGRLVGRLASTTGSGDVLSLARANALLDVAETVDELAPGAEVPALLWPGFSWR